MIERKRLEMRIGRTADRLGGLLMDSWLQIQGRKMQHLEAVMGSLYRQENARNSQPYSNRKGRLTLRLNPADRNADIVTRLWDLKSHPGHCSDRSYHDPV